MTYVAWYALSALLLMAGVIFWHEIHRRQSNPQGRHGILVEDSEDVEIDDNDVKGFNVGVGSYRSKNARIRGNRIGGADVTNDDSINITTHYQSGGTNIGKLVLNSPQPSVTGYATVENEKTDEGYVHRGEFHLDQAYAAKNICVVINRSVVKEFEVGPKGGGMWSTRPGKDKDGNLAILLEEPLVSDYEVYIVTEQPEQNLTVEARVNVSVKVDPNL